MGFRRSAASGTKGGGGGGVGGGGGGGGFPMEDNVNRIKVQCFLVSVKKEGKNANRPTLDTNKRRKGRKTKPALSLQKYEKSPEPSGGAASWKG